MHEDGNNFRRLWTRTAGNLSLEIRYQKLKVNFNYCFSHGIFQNQVYDFFVLFVSLVQFYRKICLFFFSEFLVIWMFVKNSICTLQILEKQLHVFAWSTLHKSRQTLSTRRQLQHRQRTKINKAVLSASPSSVFQTKFIITVIELRLPV